MGVSMGCRIRYDILEDAGADARVALDGGLDSGPDAPVLDAPMLDAPVLDAPVLDAPMLDAPVCVPTGDEGGGAACEDRLDNDCDGFVDGADTDCPRVRFRSVGVNASDLVTTTGEIVGDVATFAAPVPSSVGVGDVVVVVGGAFLPPPAFVSERLGPATFRVQAADGGPPAAAGPGSEVQIYRAYTSLAAWQALDENPAVPAGARDFDRDRMLVDARSTLQVALYADGDDHGNVVISGWQTSPEHYLRFFTPVRSDEVGASQRHGGAVARGYRFTADANLTAIQILQSHVRVEGVVVISFPASATHFAGVEVIGDAPDIDVRVSHNLVDGNRSDSSNGALHLEAIGASASGVFRVSNNVVWGSSVGSSECIWHRDQSGATALFYIAHNTAWNCARGIEARDTAGRAIAINNIAFSLVGPAFYEYNGPDEYGAGSTHNVSGDNTAAAPGTPSVVGADPAALFVGVDPAAPDLHLRAGAPILGMGLDLSADPRFAVTDDIDGQPRPPGAVDPGADQRSP
jgi:hypothetical protein